MRYFIHLSYNGKNYNGWQRQPDQISVQQKLEEVFSVIYNDAIKITGCGRTDSGVHAKSFYAHYDANCELPKNAVNRLNKLLPSDIGIFNIHQVQDDVNSRFDAVSRTYKYFIHFKKDAFLQQTSYWLYAYDFDMQKMNDAAQVLLSYSDFTTFEKKGSDNKTSICDIKHAKWTVMNDNQWCFTISADRFLRNMVRRITGTLLMIGLGRMTISKMEKALKNRHELEVNIAPPAHGLFLWEIQYPEKIYIGK